MVNHLKTELTELSHSMFQNEFFGLYHGSISAKTESDRFIINKKEAIFHNISPNDFLELSHRKDYRWKEASIDTPMHSQIYAQISDAKFISFSMSPYTISYSLNHAVITPKDFFGQKEYKNIPVYNPKSYEDWYDRASSEIPQYFIQNETNIIVVKGYGVYAYSRDLHSMARRLAILEKSCRLLMLSEATNVQPMDF